MSSVDAEVRASAWASFEAAIRSELEDGEKSFMDTLDLEGAFAAYAQIRGDLSAESSSSQEIAESCVDGLAELWTAASVEMESTMQGELEGALADLTELDAELLVSVMVHMELAAQDTE